MLIFQTDLKEMLWNDFLTISMFNFSDSSKDGRLVKFVVFSQSVLFRGNLAMQATLNLKKIWKFLLEGREKGLPCFAKLRQPTGQTFFPTFPKEFSHVLQTLAIAEFIGKMQKKVWYHEKWVGRHVSFPPRRSVNSLT